MKEQEIAKINSVQEMRPVKADKQQKKVGVIIPGDNHKIWEYNHQLFQLQLAKHEDIPFVYETHKVNKVHTVRKKIIANDYCYYFTALNEKNARRKIQKKYNPEFIIVLD